MIMEWLNTNTLGLKNGYWLLLAACGLIVLGLAQ